MMYNKIVRVNQLTNKTMNKQHHELHGCPECGREVPKSRPCMYCEHTETKEIIDEDLRNDIQNDLIADSLEVECEEYD